MHKHRLSLITVFTLCSSLVHAGGGPRAQFALPEPNNQQAQLTKEFIRRLSSAERAALPEGLETSLKETNALLEAFTNERFNAAPDAFKRTAKQILDRNKQSLEEAQSYLERIEGDFSHIDYSNKSCREIASIVGICVALCTALTYYSYANDTKHTT